MHQPVAPREYGDEGAEVHELGHLALIDTADFNVRRNKFNAALGFPTGRADHGGDLHGAVVLDVDRGAGLLGDLADHRPALADDVTDLFRIDLQRDDRGGPFGHLGARSAEHLVHFTKNMQAALARLRQRDAHDLGRDALDLDVHLERRNTLARSGDLEVHVTEVILVAEYVGQHLETLPLEHQPHRHAGHRRLDRDAGIHQCQAGAAHAGHRTGTVRFENFRDDAYHVGKRRHVGHHGADAPARQIAVTDLAALGAPHHAGLTHREGRKIVVQHEALAPVALQGIDDLRIARGAQRGGHQRLRLAAREQRRTMRARQYADPDGDRTDRLQVAPVDTRLAVEDAVANDLALEAEELIAHLVGREHRRLAGAQRGGDLGLDLLDARVALLLLGDHVRIAESRQRLGTDRLLERGLAAVRRGGPAWLAGFGRQLIDRANGDLHLLVPVDHGAEHDVLGQSGRLGFDHQHRVRRAGHDQIELRARQVGAARVQLILAIAVSDACASNRSLEGKAGQAQGGRSAQHRGHIGVNVRIERQHRRDDLHVIEKTFRKQRTDRPVDQAGSERLALRGAPFSAEEPARDAARGVGLLLIIDRQREKIAPGARLRFGAGRDQHDGVAHGHEYRAIGLAGQGAGFNRYGVGSKCKRFLEDSHASTLGSSEKWDAGDGAAPRASLTAH